MSHPTPVPGTQAEPGPRADFSWQARLAVWTGLAFHGSLGGLYLLSGLFAPFWAVIALWTLWTGLLAVAIHQRTRRPVIVVVIPIIGLVIWTATVWASSVLSGWAA